MITFNEYDLVNVGTNAFYGFGLYYSSYYLTKGVDQLAHKLLNVKEGTNTSVCIKAASVISCTAAMIYFAPPVVLTALSVRKCVELAIFGTLSAFSIINLTSMVNYMVHSEMVKKAGEYATSVVVAATVHGVACALFPNILGSPLRVLGYKLIGSLEAVGVGQYFQHALQKRYSQSSAAAPGNELTVHLTDNSASVRLNDGSTVSLNDENADYNVVFALMRALGMSQLTFRPL